MIEFDDNSKSFISAISGNIIPCKLSFKKEGYNLFVKYYKKDKTIHFEEIDKLFFDRKYIRHTLSPKGSLNQQVLYTIQTS